MEPVPAVVPRRRLGDAVATDRSPIGLDRSSLLRGIPSGLQVATLVAPAGYGKTTLMNQWRRLLDLKGRPCAWLALDAADATVPAFLRSLLRCLLQAGLIGRDAPRNDGATSVEAVLSGLPKSGKPITLFVDDLHLVAFPELGLMLRQVLRFLPVGSRLVLASRTQPPLELGAMAIEGKAVQFGVETLRFGDAETRRYLGPDISDEEVAAVQHATEGWPIALLIYRAMRGRTDLHRHPTMPLDEVLGRSGMLQAYFNEQVLGPLPAATRDVLSHFAILEEMTPEQAGCVTDHPEGAAILRSACDQQLFVFPVNDHPFWMRFHRLFAVHLRARSQPARAEGAIHRRIAAWLIQRGFYLQALPHIAAVDDADFVAHLLIASGGWCLLFRGGTTVARILHSLPLAVVRAYPSLELARIYRLVHTGELAQARRCFEELKGRTQDFELVSDPTHPTQADGIVMELLLSLYEDRALGPRTLINAEACIAADRIDDAIRSAVIRELLSWSLYHVGSFHKAVSIGQESVDLCVRAGVPYVQIYAYMVIGLSELAEGRVARADDIFARAGAEAAQCFGERSNQVVAARIFRAEILYARNQVVAARRDTDPWRATVADGDGWVDLFASLYRTLSSSMRVLGDGPAALDMLEQARHMARTRRLWRLEQILQNHQLREACLGGDLELAGTMARALRYEHPQSESTQHQGWRVWYPRLLALARYALDTRDLATCGDLLRDMARLSLNGTGNHALYRLERDLLQARMLFEGGGTSYARPLAHALTQAADSGLLRLVLDEGPAMMRILRQYADSFSLPRQLDAFVRDVLAAAAGEHPAEPERASGSRCVLGHAVVTTEWLSGREAGVLGLICDGLTSKEIARRLDISVNTVLTHRKNLYRKLSASTRSELITIAREQQMLKVSADPASVARAQ